MANIFKIKRRVSGAAGAPSALKSGELAWNQVDGYIYAGFGDDGSGNATSVKTVAKDDFSINQRVPSGGADGEVLTRAGSGTTWTAPSTGTTYTQEADPTHTTETYVLVNNTTDTIRLDLDVLNSRLENIYAGLAANNTFTGDVRVADFSAAGGDLVVNFDAMNAAITNFGSSIQTVYAEIAHSHGNAEITDVDASKLTGTIDVARLPVLPGSNTVVTSSNIASLTAGEQSNINMGTIVTTSDGRRWVYNSGSKTLEASYVELADVTPEWSVIANKPNFATVATSGAYADLTGKPVLATVATSGSYLDLSNRPTLGTMAAQNANGVAITGGSLDAVTIDNVTLDGGVF